MDSSENFINRFLRLESASGILLMLAAVLAIIVANTPLNLWYEMLLSTPVEIRIGQLQVAKPLLLWINDGLMAIFFLLVGLELKRELIEGELSDPQNIVLPGIGAIGGMLVPALVYLYFNYQDPIARQGWAIPAATDIAFALGVLKLLGPSVPAVVKVFLTSLAIFDDIGAILIIALFYTSKISMVALAFVAVCTVVLWILNRKNVTDKSIYLLVGVAMWVAMLKSGVHATLAGVIVAIFIPMYDRQRPDDSPVKRLEHDLHGAVAFLILPVFAFANAGITLTNIGVDTLLHPVSFGVALGLTVGKIVGVFGLCWLAVQLRLVQLPAAMDKVVLLGVSALCGIGFTMSLFIGSLAFEETNVNLLFDERIGIIFGSLVSGIIGFLILKTKFNAKSTPVN